MSKQTSPPLAGIFPFIGEMAEEAGRLLGSDLVQKSWITPSLIQFPLFLFCLPFGWTSLAKVLPSVLTGGWLEDH